MKAAKLASALLRLVAVPLVFATTTSSSVEAGFVTITDVSIEPPLPTVFNSLTVETYTHPDSTANPQMAFSNSYFEQSGTLLQLDLYFYEDGMGMGTPVELPLLEPIGMLTEGLYDLSVRAYVSPNPIALVMPELSDEYSTSFQVTPEPAMLLLLGFGGLALLRKRRS